MPTEEELRNMDEESRQQFTFDYYDGAFAHAGYKPTYRQKMKYKLGGLFSIVVALAGIAIIYGLINLVLVGGQELWHGEDKKKMEEIKSFLDGEKVALSIYDAKVNSLTDKQYDEYKQRVDNYNEKVKEYNALAEKVGGTWYVLPVPGKGTSK